MAFSARRVHAPNECTPTRRALAAAFHTPPPIGEARHARARPLVSAPDSASRGWRLPAKPSLVRVADVAAFLVGGGCLAGALGAQIGRFHPRVDLLANFAPFWLAGALLVTAYGLVSARG